MAQTSSAMSMACGKVEISLNGLEWEDISGEAASVEPGEATRRTGEMYTFDGETPIVTVGKREPEEVTVNIVYTEENTEAYMIALGAFEAAQCGTGEFYVRWSPGGGDIGDERYICSGVLTRFFWPPINAEEAGPIAGSFVVRGVVSHETIVT